MFVSPTGFPEDESQLSPLLKALKSYPNVHFRNSYLPKLVEHTPVQKWFATGKLFKTSAFPPTHLSDFLRFLLMYKFGGVYIDFDLLILKSLDTLEPNYFPREEPWQGGITGSAIVCFTHDRIGHVMARLILE